MEVPKPPTLQTETLIGELRTHASAPMRFRLATGELCLVKYILEEASEYDDLAYEWVGHYLAKHFGISTPQIAAIEVQAGSYDPHKLFRNAKNFQPGAVAFGSIHIGDNTSLSTAFIGSVRKKAYWNRIENRDEMVRLSLFDLLIDNQDRSEDNYNILITPVFKDTSKCWAIDHVAAFGGALQRGKIKPFPINESAKYVVSQHFRIICKHLKTTTFTTELEHFMYLCNSLDKPVNQAFESMPKSWRISKDLKERMLEMLTNKPRLEQLKGIWQAAVNRNL